MSRRRTYNERRAYSAKVMRFRLGVYAARGGALTPGCQLLLLRLSDDMDARGYVSVPRSVLVEDLAAPPPRITEWLKEAVEGRFLDRVRRGQPGVTAVYQGLVRTPAEVRPGVPSQRYATADHAEVRPGVPVTASQRYAQHHPQEEETSRTSESTGTGRQFSGSQRGSNEKVEDHQARVSLAVCAFHEDWEPAPADCACTTDDRRRSA